jgi:hypothetical protein
LGNTGRRNHSPHAGATTSQANAQLAGHSYSGQSGYPVKCRFSTYVEVNSAGIDSSELNLSPNVHKYLVTRMLGLGYAMDFMGFAIRLRDKEAEKFQKF